MESYSQDDILNALKQINSSISKCEKMQSKFDVGTSQHSLLRNRIKALKLAKCLIEEDEVIVNYTVEDFEKALPPIVSIIHKTEKARSKYEEGHTQFKRFTPLIEAMYVAKGFVIEEIDKRA